MTVDYSQFPSQKIRKWVYEEMINSGIIDPDLYDGINPFIPSQDVDQLNQLPNNLFYIIYFSMFAPKDNNQLLGVGKEYIYFNILANNYNDLGTIINFLIDLLGREDESARQLNNYLVGENDKTYSFLNIELSHSQEPYPIEQPLDRIVQELCFCYKYVRQIDNTGRIV